MASQVLTAAQILVGEFNFTTFTSAVETSPAEISMVPFTNYGSGGYLIQKPAIKSYGVNIKGFADFDTTGVNTAFPASRLGQQNLVAVVPNGGTTVGETGYFLRGVLSKMTMLQGDIGGAATIDVGISGDGPEIGGPVLHPLAARTTTGNGTAQAFTPPTATQTLFAGLWITAASGTTPSLTVKIQTDDNSGFTSATDQITFTAATATGWQFSSLAGALTGETHVRAQWTISGTAPSFTFAVLVGVGSPFTQ